MNQANLIEFLTFTNENFTAATVIVSASMLLYNLVRDIRDRVTRAASVLLGCVTVTYAADSIAGLEPSYTALENWYRLQWIGIAFMPAAMVHLANALLSTTGLISKGKRRLTVRVLYALSTLFAVLASLTDSVISDLSATPVHYLKPGLLFPVYVSYFAAATALSLWLMARARARCLTTSTRQRMTWLFAVFLAPGFGVFPYSPLFASIGENSNLPLLPLLLAFNMANLLVVITLIFLAYPLSFFGTDKPDRIIKTQLLEFLLRGPLIAIIILATLVTVPRLSNIFGLKSEDFVIVAVVTLLLSLQWGLTLLLPRLEKWLIYNRDQDEAHHLRQLSERLLTRADSSQLQETLLATACNQLRVPSAFIASFQGAEIRLEKVVGDGKLDLEGKLPSTQPQEAYQWENFWVYPLRSDHAEVVLGVMGIWERETPLNAEEESLLHILIERAAQILTDLNVQKQLMDSLSNFAANLESLRHSALISHYGQPSETLTNEFTDLIHGALRDLWGGPKLAKSQLLALQVVQQTPDTPTKALQSVLTTAIERLKPAGERNLNTPEWILYNILELRFLQGKKVRDVTQQLFLTESDFYRKQRIAIEAVAQEVNEMERAVLEEKEGLPISEVAR